MLFRTIALLNRGRSARRDHGQNVGFGLIALPLEILHLIISHLSYADTACLALCNHFLLTVLGKHNLAVLRDGDRASFLTTLTQDLPRHFYCHMCSRLHLRNHVRPPWTKLQPLKCLRSSGRFNGMELWNLFQAHMPVYSSYLLQHPHVQLAMKRHRHGPEHGISTDSLSYVEIQISGKRKDPERVTTLMSVEAQISRKTTSLCLRIQQWAFLRTTDSEKLLASIDLVGICDHLNNSTICQLFRADLRPRCTNIKSPLSTSVKKCRQCNTDFQIEIRTLGEEGLALVITKWLDLGSGLTPTDIKWSYYRSGDRSPTIDASVVPGDVRLLFEDETGLSQNSLSSQNASYLSKDRFMKVMDNQYPEVWTLQAGKRMPFFERLNKYQGLIFPLALIVGHFISGSLVFWGYCYGGSG